jgi:type IV pilus assembly protein PilC
MNKNRLTIRFFEMLLVLLQGKTNFIDALTILSNAGTEKNVQETAKKLLLLMKKGRTFSDSLTVIQNTKTLLVNPLYINLIKASELTGSLDIVLEHILADLQRKQKSVETIATVMMYPAIIVLVACAGTVFLLVKGLPLFINAGLLSGNVLSSAINGIIFAGVFLGVAGAAVFFACYKVFGDDSAEFRLFYLLSFLLQAKIPLNDALSQCIVGIHNAKYGKALIQIKKEISSGVHLSAAFAHTNVFSSYITGWLAIADENGDVTSVCRNIAAYFQKRDEHIREIASRCIEPVIIVITGIYLLILLQAVVLPLLTRAGGLL